MKCYAQAPGNLTHPIGKIMIYRVKRLPYAAQILEIILIEMICAPHLHITILSYIFNL